MNGKILRGYIFLAVAGALLLAAGVGLMILFAEPQGMMKTLPFVCLGVGAGALSGGIGGAVGSRLMRKNPDMAKQKEIAVKDERNIAIANKAKAKAFHYTWMLFPCLLLFLAMMQVNLAVILVFVAAYLSVIILFIYLFNKYDKEM